jgi:hypothetical protein
MNERSPGTLALKSNMATTTLCPASGDASSSGSVNGVVGEAKLVETCSSDNSFSLLCAIGGNGLL